MAVAHHRHDSQKAPGVDVTVGLRAPDRQHYQHGHQRARRPQREKPQEPRSTLASTACYIYPKETLPLFEEFLKGATSGKDAPGYFNAWLLTEKGVPMDAFPFDTGWYDIGDRASYIEANRRYANADTWKGKDVVIENSTVTNSVLFDEVVVVDSSIEGCVIDRGGHIEGVDLRDCLIGERTVVKRA